MKEKEVSSLASQGTERTRRLRIHAHREATGGGVRAESAPWLITNPVKVCKISHTRYRKICRANKKAKVRKCFCAIEGIRGNEGRVKGVYRKIPRTSMGAQQVHAETCAQTAAHSKPTWPPRSIIAFSSFRRAWRAMMREQEWQARTAPGGENARGRDEVTRSQRSSRVTMSRIQRKSPWPRGTGAGCERQSRSSRGRGARSERERERE